MTRHAAAELLALVAILLPALPVVVLIAACVVGRRAP
jgi:hypothetical protein